ncbi:MAG: NAD(P)/FAD-dependent oxidoreductase [Eubacteriales bacterium]
MNRQKIECNRLLSETISLPYTADSGEAITIAKQKLKRALKGKMPDVSCSVYRRSVDARRRDDIRFVYTVLLQSEEYFSADKEALEHEGFRICPHKEIEYEYGTEKCEARPIVVGSGPAGMFCALMLAENGYRPVLIERGSCIEKRVCEVNAFFGGGELNTECNVMFGAGGAGTFSDGKLVTRISDPLCGYVFSRLCEFGAPGDIIYKAKPHVGTDLLRGIVSSVLDRIEQFGGNVIYNCRLDGIVENCDSTVVAKTGMGDMHGSCVVLAIGHSARDTYKYLNDNGYSLIAKPFSVGVRIEHLRSDIDYALYGDHTGDPLLGAAEYALSDTKSGRGVYTFCMCPGGQVIAASSEEGGLVVNGMSYHARDGVNSNSAVAVSVLPTDYDNTPMGAIEFQRGLEMRAFALGGGNFAAPIETLGDYLSETGKSMRMPTKILPTYTRGLSRVADISSVFPKPINDELRRGFVSFGKKLRGFDSPDAVMTAVESRTSAPIRILRGENGVALGHTSIYPCGEGAGYAGGITSAAVDGIRTALAIIKRFAP